MNASLQYFVRRCSTSCQWRRMVAIGRADARGSRRSNGRGKRLGRPMSQPAAARCTNATNACCPPSCCQPASHAMPCQNRTEQPARRFHHLDPPCTVTRCFFRSLPQPRRQASSLTRSNRSLDPVTRERRVVSSSVGPPDGLGAPPPPLGPST